MRAQRIRTAKLDAMAEGRPYKPEKRRRGRRAWWEDMYAARERARPSTTEHNPATSHDQPRPATTGYERLETATISGPGLDAHSEAIEEAGRPGGFRIALWAMFHERERDDRIEV